MSRPWSFARIPDADLVRTLRSTFASAACLFATAGAAAATVGDGLQHVDWLRWPTEHPDFGAAGSFTRMVAGDVSGDGIPDAFVLSGSKVVFFENPGIHTALSVVPRLANDLDVTPVLVMGERADLALVTASGLEILQLRQPDPEEPPEFQAGPVVTGNWVGATKVRSGDLDGTDEADFVGVGSDGKTLISRLDGGAEDTFLSPRVVLDFAILRWTANVDARVAVLTSTGITIYDPQTWDQVGSSFAHEGVPGGVIAVVNAGTVDHIAWVRGTTSGPERIVILADGVSPQPGPSLPAGLHVVAAAAGDSDDDEDDDLFLSQDQTCAPYFCENTGNAFATPVEIDADQALHDASGATNQALPLVADLDLDGTDDLMVPVQPTAGFSLLARDLTPAPITSFFQAYTDFSPHLTLPGHRQLRLRFKFSSFLPTHYVEVVGWKQSGYGGVMQPEMFLHEVYLVPSSIAGVEVGADMLVGMTDPAQHCFEDIYWFEVREVNYDEDSGGITAQGPTYIAALVSFEEWIALLNEGERWNTSGATPPCGESPPEPGQRAPAIVPNRRAPNFETGVVPSPRPPTQPLPEIVYIP